MDLQCKILKATLLLRRWGNTYLSKEEQIAEFSEWYTKENESNLDEWIASLKEDLAKTPEQLEKERMEFLEMLIEGEAEQEYIERMSNRRYRDEWDDLWADRAKEVGASIWL